MFADAVDFAFLGVVALDMRGAGLENNLWGFNINGLFFDHGKSYKARLTKEVSKRVWSTHQFWNLQ